MKNSFKVLSSSTNVSEEKMVNLKLIQQKLANGKKNNNGKTSNDVIHVNTIVKGENRERTENIFGDKISENCSKLMKGKRKSMETREPLAV